MGKLFGTDGIRGVANEYPMTPELALILGKAIAFLFKKETNTTHIVVARDPRLSGDMIEYALISGICSCGVNVFHLGIKPTPAAAFLTVSSKAAAGVMISASHNPYYDNGIKIFNGDGYKLSDEKEHEIESMITSGQAAGFGRSMREVGQVVFEKNAESRYVDFLISLFPANFSAKGLKVVIDCSNGATYRVAPQAIERIGADLETLFNAPDGKNINDRCGSQHPEGVVKKVRETGADVGLAFDGDGDRLIAVDEKGNRVTGDQIIAICANHLKNQGMLKNNRVVTTVMSNIGLKIAFKRMGIDLCEAPVGDRYVLEEMIRSGAVLGGEDSGHMIFLDHHTTGDGIFTALKLIEALMSGSKPLSELTRIVEIFPQVLMNVPVRKRTDIEKIPELVDVIREVEAELGEKGRVLVRYSGTQPLCRVMVEGPTDLETRSYCRRIVDVVEKKLGI